MLITMMMIIIIIFVIYVIITIIIMLCFTGLRGVLCGRPVCARTTNCKLKLSRFLRISRRIRHLCGKRHAPFNACMNVLEI